ncbi:flagellar basal body rod protein FlgB [candidate division KSB1 bacterium]|nr:MAG: flagellar basal body rod protein FlgB [candidate division KSB1 bacterium]
MINSIFSKTTIPLMKRVLDIASERQKVIASNIANSSTPGYKTRKVDFKKSLSLAQQSTGLAGLTEDERHLPLGSVTTKSAVVKVENTEPDVEKEMAESAENQLLYASAVKIISGKFQALKGSIRGRF